MPVFTSELIKVSPTAPEVELENFGILHVIFEYILPNKKRASKTSIFYKILCNVTVSQVTGGGVNSVGPFNLLNGTGVDGIIADPTDPTTTASPIKYVQRITIRPSALGDILKENLLVDIQQIQSAEVRYRVVDIIVYKSMNWKDGIAEDGENLVELKSYRYKCGSGLTGKADPSSFISEQSLVYTIYGKGLDAASFDRPSRFLVQGSIFKTQSEVDKSQYAANIESHLANGYSLKVGTYQIQFIPVSDAVGSLREVDLVRYEGLRELAGSINRGKVKKESS